MFRKGKRTWVLSYINYKLFYFRFNRVKNLAASLPSNLLPTRDTKEYRQAFEYKNHTVFDEDEDEMIDGNFYVY